MKERPILFTGEMIRAILDGRKTQARRVVKPSIIQEIDVEHDKTFTMDSIVCDVMDGLKVRDVCPYGQPGDCLWVRETWKYGGFDGDGIPYIMYREGLSAQYKMPDECWVDRVHDIWAKLSAPENYNRLQTASDLKWRPSIFMPKWASRITLEITDIRVKRVQNISHNDACREGVLLDGPGDDPVSAFERLWDTINAKSGFGWDSNPWVWVIEFKRVEP